MRIVKIENNKIYSTSTLCEKTDIFEIVEKIPVGFFVWNIGFQYNFCYCSILERQPWDGLPALMMADQKTKERF